MLVDEWALLLHMAAITDQVHRRLLQESECLSMRVVAVAAEHLSFEDRVVRRHLGKGVDLRMALVAGVGVVDRHRPSLWPTDIGVSDIQVLLNMAVGVWIMAVGALDSLEVVNRRMPRDCWGELVTRQA